MRLRPCRRCQRHVRIGDTCPFCAREPARATPTLGALALAGALSVGCGGAPHEEPTTPAHEQTVAPSDPAPMTQNDPEPEQAPPEEPAAPEDHPTRGPDGGGAIAAYGGPSPGGPSAPPR